MTNKKSGCHKDSHPTASTPLRRNRKHKVIIKRIAKYYKLFFAAGAVMIAFSAGATCGQYVAEPEMVIVEREVEVIVPQQVIYPMTDAERYEIASVVQAEAGGEPYAGKVAVAQCIFQAVKDDDITPREAVKKYSYTKNRPEPSAESFEAVDNVFLYGHVVTAEPIKYFYADALVNSAWHESQNYVMRINGHKFFSEK